MKTKDIEHAYKCAREHKDFRLKTTKSIIFLTGGILTKLENDEQYFAIGGKWVKS